MQNGDKIIRRVRIKFMLLITCNFLLVSSFSLSGAENDEAALNSLKLYIQSLGSFNANFEQAVYGQSGELLESSTGIVSLKKPGKFYWQYQQPYSQYLISDGTVLWIYDEDLDQVSINNIDQNIRTSPAAILGGEIEIEDNYIVTDMGKLDETNWIELVSNQEDAEFNAIRLGFEEGELSGMILFDKLGQITELFFLNVLRDHPLDESLFKFNPPDGVDIIDARDP
jgi:outer membrane lipoprotein carrier protein